MLDAHGRGAPLDLLVKRLDPIRKILEEQQRTCRNLVRRVDDLAEFLFLSLASSS